MTNSEDEQLLNHSPLESARFDLRVYRGYIAPEDTARLWGFIESNRVDVAIVRIPAENISAMRSYGGPWDQVIHADTLVYYDCRLDRYEIPSPVNNDVVYRFAAPDDRPALESVVKQVFFDYQNHYHANPAFSRKAVLEGYQEWALDHLHPEGNTPSWVALDGNIVVGFICCRLHANSSAEIVLNGVLASHAGKGIYGDLVRIAQRHFADLGINLIRVSTQVGNYRVQRVWNRSGFVLAEAFDTWHVNAMLTKATLGPPHPVAVSN
jgi:GNAT superfamily N-acetyltransferase